MLDLVTNLIFPSRNLCLICREEDLSGKHLCLYCRENLELVDEYFHIDSSYIEDAYYSLFYNRFIREVIKDYKYNGKNYLYKSLAEIMMDTIRMWQLNVDSVIYIPMHRRKEAIRGYNQARLLAMYIGKSMDIPLIDHNLIKHKNTKDQSHSDKFERTSNLKNAFKIKNPVEIRDKKILLVDDIITTGSTMAEASKVLMENGAKKVTGIALTSSKKR